MKQKLTKLLCSVFLVAFAIPAIAQSSGGSSTRTITGKVTDSEGAPIVGAVVMASQREATTTNSEGRYTLAVQSPDAVLRFSCMGYRPRSENTAGRTVVDVSLETDNQLLEDVVVVGYGVQKKVNLTGAVASIDFSKTSESRSIISTSAALAGLAAGMNVTQSSGQPGSDNATIRIRGDGSFTSGANGPLVLVDGVEWSMDNVNPNDIASISVLKDAASASIYGTRAANGVILITTKNGSAGKAQISYSYKGILQMPYNDLHFVSDYARHMELINESCDNIGTSRIFSQSNIDLWREKSSDPYGVGENGVPNFALYPNTDWFDEIFENGYSQEHNLSISGGSEKIRYLLSLGYLDNQGVMGRFGIDSSTQKVNFRTNLEADVTKWFTAGVRLFGQRQEYGLANISNAFNALYQTTPGVYPGSVNAWGRPALAAEESSNANNIFGMMYGSGGYNNSTRVNGSVYATIRPYRGVSVEATVNYSPTFGERHSYGRENGYWDYTTDTRYSSSDLSNAGVSNTTSRNYYLSSEILARYTATVGDHDFGVLFGYSAMEYRTWGWGVSKQGATDWTLNDLGTYETLSGSSSTAKNGWGLRSYFGRINYAYKNRYLLEANLRADGSSRFGSNNRYGIFPSFSAGWKIHEERFMEGTEDWLSNLKLRASWGKAGNNQGIGNYAWQAVYATQNVVVDGSGSKGLYISSLSNADLKWETTATTDGLHVQRRDGPQQGPALVRRPDLRRPERRRQLRRRQRHGLQRPHEHAVVQPRRQPRVRLERTRLQHDVVGCIRLLHHLERPLLQRNPDHERTRHQRTGGRQPLLLRRGEPRGREDQPQGSLSAADLRHTRRQPPGQRVLRVQGRLPETEERPDRLHASLPDHEEVLRPAAAVLRIGREPAHHHRLPGPRSGERLRHRLSPHAFGHIRSTDNILTTMKKLYYTILATAAALTTASCVDLLNTAPENQIASENMWTTPELALKGMNGLYETFYNRKQSNGTQVRSENLDGLNKYGIEALGFCTDYYANNYPIYLLYNQAKRANDWQLAHEWKFCYTIVHAANDAVTNLHKAGLDAQTYERYLCEARFLRAWAYSRLNKFWQGVPVYLEPISNEQCTRTQESAEYVWREVVLPDLKYCIDNASFPDNTLGESNFGRPSKGAAYALRGMAYMWLERKWHNAAGRLREGRPVRLRSRAGRVHRLLQPRQRARQRDDLRPSSTTRSPATGAHTSSRPGRCDTPRRLGRRRRRGFRRLLPERRRHGVQMEPGDRA